MINQIQKELIKRLEECLRQEWLTLAKKVGPSTFVCFTATDSSGGLSYTQCEWELMPEGFKRVMAGKQKGDEFLGGKIIAIYDIWDNDFLPTLAPYPIVLGNFLNDGNSEVFF